MASPTSTTRSPRTPAHRRVEPSPPRSVWPTGFRLRALTALGLALPFVLVAIKAYHGGLSDSANDRLVHQSHLIRWGSGDLSFISHVYPPIPTVLAAVFPHPMALGIVGAVGAGVILEALAFRLTSRGYPTVVALVLVATFGLTPSFAATATSDLATFMSLTLLVVALDGYLRFALRGHTHGGFQAGLAIGLAVLCNAGAILLAIAFALAAPLVAHQRYRGERAAGRASAAVLLFPTVAGLTGWTYLCWRFSDDPLAWLRTSAPSLWHDAGSLNRLQDALGDTGRVVVLTPILLLAVAIMLTSGKVVQCAGILLPLPCLFLADYLGLPIGAPAIAIVLGVVGIMSLPGHLTRRFTAVIVAVAVLGFALRWAFPVSDAVRAWEGVVGVR